MPAAPATTAWRVLLAVLALAVAWLAFSPNPPQTLASVWDKLQHVAAFAALGLCAARGLVPLAAWRVALGLLGYGVFIELVQTQIPGRSGEWPDLLADSLGIAFGLLLHRLLPRRQRG